MLCNPSAYIRIPAEHYPNRTCLTFKGRSFTYEEINLRANRLAGALSGLGFSPGSRIATLQYNCNQSFELFVAMWKAGLVMIPLNTRDSASQNLAILEDSEAEGLVFGREFLDQAEHFKRSFSKEMRFVMHGKQEKDQQAWLDYEELMAAAPGDEPDLEIDENALYKIHYTSGTTGAPRGVMMTYRNRMSQIANVFMNADRLIDHNEVFLHVAPLTHAAGYYSTPYYLKGARHVVLDKFDSTHLLETIEVEGVTCTLLVPTMIVMLLEDPNLSRFDLSSLKRIFYGTAPMPFDKLKRALKVFGPIFRQNYGLTESVQPLASLLADEHILESDEQLNQRLRSTGKRAIGTEIRLVDEQDQDVPAAQIGEIILRGFQVSPGYLNLPEETKVTHRQGWLHTGDLGLFDAEGYLYIVDRKKDMIISGGFNIYSREVELHLDNHPAVLESAVIGLPDEKWGETCTACLVLRPGMSPPEAEEIFRHCVSNGLPKYKAPKFVVYMDSLPKNENKKIIKKRIKELLLDFNSGLEVLAVG